MCGCAWGMGNDSSVVKLSVNFQCKRAQRSRGIDRGRNPLRRGLVQCSGRLQETGELLGEFRA